MNMFFQYGNEIFGSTVPARNHTTHRVGNVVVSPTITPILSIFPCV